MGRCCRCSIVIVKVPVLWPHPWYRLFIILAARAVGVHSHTPRTRTRTRTHKPSSTPTHDMDTGVDVSELVLGSTPTSFSLVAINSPALLLDASRFVRPPLACPFMKKKTKLLASSLLWEDSGGTM